MNKVFYSVICSIGLAIVFALVLEATSSILSPLGWWLVLALGSVGLLLLIPMIVRTDVFVSWLSLACVAGWIGFCAINSPVEYALRNDLILMALSVVGYALGSVICSVRGWSRVLILTMVLLGVANLGVGVYQFLSDPTFVPWPGVGIRDVGRRATGFFPNANHLSILFEVIVPCCLALALFLKKPGLRLLLGYIGLAFLVVSLLSGSRGGMLGMVIGLVALGLMVFWLRIRQTRHRIVALTVGLISAAVLVVGSTQVFRHALKERGNKSIVEDRSRFDLWTSVVQQFRTSPLMGTGSLTYEVYARKYRPSDWGGWRDSVDPRLAHNDYLQLLGEYGLIGAALMFVFVVVHFYNGWRYLRWRQELGDTSGWRIGMCVGFLSALVAVGVHEFFDFGLHIYSLAVLVAVIFGWVGALRIPDDDKRSRWWNLPGFLVLAAAVGIIFVLGRIACQSESAFEKGMRLSTKNEHFVAVAHFREAVQIDPVHYPAWIRFGISNQALGQSFPEGSLPQKSYFGKATRAFDEAIKLYPKNPYHHMLAAQNFDLMGLYDLAENSYLKALELAPNHRNYKINYADHLLTLGYYTANIEALKRAEDLYRRLRVGKKRRDALRLIKAFEAKRLNEERQTDATNPDVLQ